MARQTVLLHGRDPHKLDGEASAAVTPGELLEVTGVSGDYRTYAPHATADDPAAPRFALEYSHTGGTIDTDYAAGDHMEYRHCLPGDNIYAFVAVGENVAVGDALTSAGNGALAVHTPQADLGAGEEVDVEPIVAEAVEAVDNTGGSEPVRIKVEVV